MLLCSRFATAGLALALLCPTLLAAPTHAQQPAASQAVPVHDAAEELKAALEASEKNLGAPATSHLSLSLAELSSLFEAQDVA